MPHERTSFHSIPLRIEGDMGWGSTPTPCLPLSPHIGKCARAPGAWCGIGSTRNRVPNAVYFVRIREDLRELGRVQVPPPAPPRCTCQIGSATRLIPIHQLLCPPVLGRCCLRDLVLSSRGGLRLNPLSKIRVRTPFVAVRMIRTPRLL